MKPPLWRDPKLALHPGAMVVTLDLDYLGNWANFMMSEFLETGRNQSMCGQTRSLRAQILYTP